MQPGVRLRARAQAQYAAPLRHRGGLQKQRAQIGARNQQVGATPPGKQAVVQDAQNTTPLACAAGTGSAQKCTADR